MNILFGYRSEYSKQGLGEGFALYSALSDAVKHTLAEVYETEDRFIVNTDLDVGQCKTGQLIYLYPEKDHFTLASLERRYSPHKIEMPNK